jgi:hypothetical protein
MAKPFPRHLTVASIMAHRYAVGMRPRRRFIDPCILTRGRRSGPTGSTTATMTARACSLAQATTGPIDIRPSHSFPFPIRRGNVALYDDADLDRERFESQFEAFGQWLGGPCRPCVNHDKGLICK